MKVGEAIGRWRLAGCPERPGVGQRFFTEKGDSSRYDKDWRGRELWTADNSGDHPDNTDDGPLLWLRDLPIRAPHL